MVLKIKTVKKQLTDEEKMQNHVNSINQILLTLHTQISHGFQAVQMTILENRDGFTREQMRAAYGEDIEELDAIGEKVGELLQMLEIDSGE